MNSQFGVKVFGFAAATFATFLGMGLAQASSGAGRPVCVAEHRLTIDRSRIDIKEIEMPVTYEDSVYLRYEADLMGFGYVVLLEKKTNHALVTLAKAPDYVEGSNTNTTFNSDGRFTLSMVGTQTLPQRPGLVRTVAKITCQR